MLPPLPPLPWGNKHGGGGTRGLAARAACRRRRGAAAAGRGGGKGCTLVGGGGGGCACCAGGGAPVAAVPVTAAPRRRRHCGAAACGVLPPLPPPPSPPWRFKHGVGGTRGLVARAARRRRRGVASMDCRSDVCHHWLRLRPWGQLHADRHNFRKTRTSRRCRRPCFPAAFGAARAVPALFLPPIAKHRAQLKGRRKQLRPVRPPT